MKKVLYILILSAFIASVSLLAYEYLYPEETVEIIENESEITTSSTEGIINLGGGVMVEMIDSVVSTTTLAKLNMTTLDRPIVDPRNVSLESFKKNEASVSAIISSLKEKPESFDQWMELGTYRKIFVDYTGAKEAWENALILKPKNPLALSNLGNLYGYYIKDNVKAEEYYLASIKSDPTSGFWYYQAFLFYTEVMNDKVSAKNIVSEGLKNNPNDLELENILNSL